MERHWRIVGDFWLEAARLASSIEQERFTRDIRNALATAYTTQRAAEEAAAQLADTNRHASFTVMESVSRYECRPVREVPNDLEAVAREKLQTP